MLYVPRAQSARDRGLYEASLLVGGMTAVIPWHRPDVVLGFVPSLAAAGSRAGRRRYTPCLMVSSSTTSWGQVPRRVVLRGGPRVMKSVEALEGWPGRWGHGHRSHFRFLCACYGRQGVAR